MNKLKRISVVAGHYGSGKTNISVNMALKLARQGEKVTIVDLDIVNPYFRTADFKELLENENIHVITPTYANTNLDIPALPAEVNSVFDQKDAYVIIDVGGDDAGAIALGRYARFIAAEDYDMYYVINENRYQTKSPNEAVELLQEIEYCAKVKATKLINNSNLGSETTIDTVMRSNTFANKVSELTGLPIAFTCINQEIDKKESNLEPVEIFVKPFYA